MKVSIITATYNRESTVVRAISSIKNQTYQNIQVIVIDGASKDNTISLIKPMLSDEDVIQSEPDGGIYDALNKGLAIADGEIVAFLHSDDLYSDNYVISNVVKIFLDQSIDIVYGDVSFFSNNEPAVIKRKYKSGALSKRRLAWGKMPAHPAIFIRRRVYDKVGFFKTNFKIAADYEFLCRVINYKNLKSIYLHSVLVQMQLGGISTKGLKSTFILNKEVYRALRSNGIYTNLFMLLSKYPSKFFQFLRL